MSKRRSIGALSMLALALSAAWAQDSSAPPSTGDAPQTGQQEPAPAYGQENAPPPISENPPLSGLDLPSLEPHAAPLSYLQPGATISESADSNVANSLGSGSVRSVSRALGSLTLQRLWSHYDLAADYIGGVAYYNLKGQGFKALQQGDVDQKISWKRGQLSLRDSFSYLPEGNFGGSYGSLGSQGIESLGNTSFSSFLSGASLGTLGLTPRILNVSLADVSENLTPKSAVTAAGGYAYTHFFGNDPLTNAPLLGNSQISAQVGYNRLLTAHTQVALVYGYQGFDFNVFGSAFHTHVIQAMYGHRISGRLDFLVGAGPQITLTRICPLFVGGACLGAEIPDTRLGVAGQARLRYRFPKTSLDVRYERYETSGSGLFAGAQSDIATFSLSRPLSRVWSGSVDMGYSRNSRLQPLNPQLLSTCGNHTKNQPPCPGIDANIYTFGFAGAALQRAFGRNFHGFVSYQFNELAFDHTYCGGVAVCSRISNRHVGTIGLDWTPRPIRID
jgi:hypothetical protein